MTAPPEASPAKGCLVSQAGFAMLVIGLAFGALGGVWLRSSLDPRDTATAEVVSQSRYVDAEGDVTFSPVVTFRVGDVEHRVEDIIQRSTPIHEVGDLVTVRYRPGEPDRASIVSRGRTVARWTGVSVLLALGLLLVIAGLRTARRS